MSPAAIAIATVFLNSLIPAAGIAATVWLLFRLMPRINAATRHLLWWCALAAILIIPVIPRAGRRPASFPRYQAFVQRQMPPVPDRFIRPVSRQPAIAGQTPVELPPGRWPIAVLLIWTALALGQLARLAASYAWLSRLKRRARPAVAQERGSFDGWLRFCGAARSPQLLVSAEVSSPMAVGFFHPAIILPGALIAELQQAELDHVLLHELAHIVRRDDWTNLGARLAGAVLALHPVAQWIIRRIDRERELACDEWAVSMAGAVRPYAASLARLFEMCARRRRELLATGMATHCSQLGARIESLLRRRGPVVARLSRPRLALIAAVIAAILLASGRMPRWVAFAQAAPPRPAMPVFIRRQPAVIRQFPPIRAYEPTRRSLLAAIVADGYDDLSVDQIIDLKNAGVTPEFLDGIARSGWGKLDPVELMDLRRSGLSPEYLRRMGDAGISGLSAREVIGLRNQGVDPDAVREIHSLGFGPYTARDVTEFWIHGVRAPLFRALHDAGFRHLDPGEAIDAQNCGLTADNLRQAEQYGPKLTLSQIIRLKRAGVL